MEGSPAGPYVGELRIGDRAGAGWIHDSPAAADRKPGPAPKLIGSVPAAPRAPWSRPARRWLGLAGCRYSPEPGRMMSTGTRAIRQTRSVTVPTGSQSATVAPRLLMTMRSTFRSSATRAISSAA